MSEKLVLSLKDIVGEGYNEFWNYKGRFRVVKGSRASKKSKTAALNFIYRIMKYKGSNLLVIRKTFRTLRESCFAELNWAIDRLKVRRLWSCKISPLEMTYKPTGQKIYFRGLDDPLKITSIAVSSGSLCWIWIEEAYEIANEADFDILQESVRGAVPEDLFKQITLTFNPWNERHWLKKRFFDNQDADTLAMTVNYNVNEWLDESDRRMFENMKLNNPRRYKVAGLGEWGVTEGLVYENWETAVFNTEEILKRGNVKTAFGLDFGYTNDPTALFCGIVDFDSREIFVFDELYKKGLSNKRIYDEIRRMGFTKEKIRADCAEPKSIAELRSLGITRICAARKGRDSLNNGIQFIQNYKIIIHPSCANFISEISSYSWAEDKLGNVSNIPVDSFNHLLDAMRYALEEFMTESFSFH